MVNVAQRPHSILRGGRQVVYNAETPCDARRGEFAEYFEKPLGQPIRLEG